MRIDKFLSAKRWQTVIIGVSLVFGCLLSLQNLHLDLVSDVWSAQYQDVYSQVMSIFQSRGETIPTNVAAGIIERSGGDQNQVVATLEKYLNVYKALQARNPDVSSLVISLIAKQYPDNYSQASTALSQTVSTAKQIQDYQNINTIAAQIVAALGINNSFTQTLSDAYDVVNNASNMGQQMNVNNTAAQILSALDLTGELSSGFGSQADLQNTLQSMTRSSLLQSQDAKDVLGALDIFTPGNFSADAGSVSKIASDLLGSKLSDAVKSVVDKEIAESLGALNLGSLSGLSEGKGNFSGILEQVTSKTAGEAGKYKDVYDTVTKGMSTQDIVKMGTDKIKDSILGNSTLDQEKATQETKKELDQEAKKAVKERMNDTEYYFAITLKENGKVIGELFAHSERGEPHNTVSPLDTFSPCWMLSQKYQGSSKNTLGFHSASTL